MIFDPRKQGIEPGIYRFDTISHVWGVPGIRTDEDFDLKKELNKLIEKEKTYTGIVDRDKGDFPRRLYFPTIEAFLETWKKGYEQGKPSFGTNIVYDKLGFELYYYNWDSQSDFFKIGDHTGIIQMGKRLDLDSIMILGDNNGMNDQRGYLNLGVNDFRRLKSYTFRDKKRGEKINLTSSEIKLLRNDISYYVFDVRDTFPFGTPNSLKSSGNMWAAIGINPHDVYAEVEKMGFVFPSN